MKIDSQKLEKALRQCDYEELVGVLKNIFMELEEATQLDAYTAFYCDHVILEMTEDELLSHIKDFYQKSLKGEYFDHSWEWSSKTYDEVTPLTQSWYDEISCCLNATSVKALQGKKEMAKAGYQLLLDLIDHLEHEEIIVAHHTIGEDHIYCEYDYRKTSKELL